MIRIIDELTYHLSFFRSKTDTRYLVNPENKFPFSILKSVESQTDHAVLFFNL